MNGLKSLNNLVTRLHPCQNNVAKAKHDIAIIEKELKALEIIKEKEVYISGLTSIWLKGGNYDGTVDDYNDMIGDFDNWLTQEEYELLREVFVNENE